MLHHDRQLFEQIVLRASSEFNINPAIVEKDYYVTIFLNLLSQRVSNIVFKGGTSLSKCFNLIKRFSEDIDLNLISKKAAIPTETERKRLKEAIEDTADSLQLLLINPDEIGSKKKFNRFVFSYDTLFSSGYLKQNLIVETATAIPSFPTVVRQTSSYIYSYVSTKELIKLIDVSLIAPFEIKVQSLERTLVDKAFALGDYYLSGNIAEHSRHIYDIAKLLELVQLDENLRRLFEEVRLTRKNHRSCLSAQDNQNLSNLLSGIIDEHTFEQDYKLITEALLFETATYEHSIEKLKELIPFASV